MAAATVNATSEVDRLRSRGMPRRSQRAKPTKMGGATERSWRSVMCSTKRDANAPTTTSVTMSVGKGRRRRTPGRGAVLLSRPRSISQERIPSATSGTPTVSSTTAPVCHAMDERDVTQGVLLGLRPAVRMRPGRLTEPSRAHVGRPTNQRAAATPSAASVGRKRRNGSEWNVRRRRRGRRARERECPRARRPAAASRTRAPTAVRSTSSAARASGRARHAASAQTASDGDGVVERLAHEETRCRRGPGRRTVRLSRRAVPAGHRRGAASRGRWGSAVSGHDKRLLQPARP